MDGFIVYRPIEISADKIQNLICCALEGGSNYWYFIDSHILPEGTVYDDFKEGGKFQNPDNYWHPYEIIPLMEGGALIFSVEDEPGKTWTLDREAILRGLELMSVKWSKFFSQVLEENEDAETGDVFLQLCLFGDVIYG